MIYLIETSEARLIVTGTSGELFEGYSTVQAGRHLLSLHLFRKCVEISVCQALGNILQPMLPFDTQAIYLATWFCKSFTLKNATRISL